MLTISSNAHKDKAFLCKYPSPDGLCNLKKGQPAIFKRQPDLVRHYESVHMSQELRPQFVCDYRDCGRAAGGECISRKDHLREHYREHHLEDLLLSKLKEEDNEPWWRSRDLKTTKWRCSKCLCRNKESHGWLCGDCGKPCEKERVARRKQVRNPRGGMIINDNIAGAREEMPNTNDMSGRVTCDMCSGYGYGYDGVDQMCHMCQGSGYTIYSNFDEQMASTYTNTYS